MAYKPCFQGTQRILRRTRESVALQHLLVLVRCLHLRRRNPELETRMCQLHTLIRIMHRWDRLGIDQGLHSLSSHCTRRLSKTCQRHQSPSPRYDAINWVYHYTNQINGTQKASPSKVRYICRSISGHSHWLPKVTKEGASISREQDNQILLESLIHIYICIAFMEYHACNYIIIFFLSYILGPFIFPDCWFSVQTTNIYYRMISKKWDCVVRARKRQKGATKGNNES